MQHDPREIINKEPMRALQVFAVGICVFLNALDGFDVLAITFAAPAIKEAWGIGPSAIGIIISTGLVGMALGSLFLAPLADKYGRRNSIMVCIVIMGVGMLLSATATDIYIMSIYRVLTGLGIGIMLAVINAMAAEYSNEKRRDFSVSLMAVGYPIGGVLGGSVAALLLEYYDWHAVFIFGGLVTLALLPVVFFFLPESIEFLAMKKGKDALEETNKILERLGHRAATHIVLPEKAPAKVPLFELFSRDIIRNTITLTAAYFLHITTFYYVMGWAPTIVASLGFDDSVAASVSVWVSVGGIIGGSILGWMATYFGMGRLLVLMMFGTAILVTAFGQVTPELGMLTIVAFILGMFVFSGVVGLYALVAKAFPTNLRSTGTGFVIGMGRAGAVIGPIITGFLFEAGMERGGVAMVMAAGSLLAGLSLIIGKLNKS